MEKKFTSCVNFSVYINILLRVSIEVLKNYGLAKNQKMAPAHVGLDSVSLYFQIVLDVGPLRNDGNRTLCDFVKLRLE